MFRRLTYASAVLSALKLPSSSCITRYLSTMNLNQLILLGSIDDRSSSSSSSSQTGPFYVYSSSSSILNMSFCFFGLLDVSICIYSLTKSSEVICEEDFYCDFLLFVVIGPSLTSSISRSSQACSSLSSESSESTSSRKLSVKLFTKRSSKVD